MTRKTLYQLFTLCAVFFAGCEANNKKEAKADSIPTLAKPDTLPHYKPELKETFEEEDSPRNEYLIERLKPIRENFKKINSIPNSEWSLVEKKELQETLEGGEAMFYYYNQNLDKITARRFGETFQQLDEYYLLEGKLSFVLEKTINYNRPITHDSTAMRENKDDQTFDFKQSEVTEYRSYFENGKLLHIDREDCGAPWSSEYLQEEQIRIKKDFEQLIKLTRTK